MTLLEGHRDSDDEEDEKTEYERGFSEYEKIHEDEKHSEDGVSLPSEQERGHRRIWKMEWGIPPERTFDYDLKPLVFLPHLKKRSRKFLEVFNQWIRQDLAFACPSSPSCLLCKTQGLIFSHKANRFSRFSLINKYQDPLRRVLYDSLHFHVSNVLEDIIQEYAEPLPFLFACEVHLIFQKGLDSTFELEFAHDKYVWDYDIHPEPLWICYECVNKHINPDPKSTAYQFLLDTLKHRMLF